MTNQDLIKYCAAFVGNPYFYGTFGQIASRSLYDIKRKQYPAYYKWAYNSNYTGKRVFDCVGLLKGFLWSAGNPNKNPVYNSKEDYNADDFFTKFTNKKGKIKDVPEVKGLLVHAKRHIGVYIGGGYVIEAKGHAYGIIKSKLSSGAWTEYGYFNKITYTSDSEPVKPSKPVSNVKYYPTVKSSYKSIVDALDSIGVTSTYKYRKQIAIVNGIKNYSGQPQQNIDMLNMLKAGKLKKI